MQVTIVGRLLPKRMQTGQARFMKVGATDDDVLLCSVEELALDHYKLVCQFTDLLATFFISVLFIYLRCLSWQIKFLVLSVYSGALDFLLMVEQFLF